MQSWSIPLQVFAILKRELPDIPPTQYMQHLSELPRRVRYELMLLATGDHFVDTEQLEDAISHVFMRQQGNKILLKYAPTVQYGNLWNPYYRQCRGTVIDMDEMRAYHSYDKFYNVSEVPENDEDVLLQKAESVGYQVMNKWDGSLIMFYYDGEWCASTKGAFDSEQAQWAMQHAQRYRLVDGFDKDYTYMFEAIYPDNRIVVNYNGRDMLIPLARRNMQTGQLKPLDNAITDADRFMTLQDCLNQRDKYAATEKEGWVIAFDDGHMVKLKCTDYVTVHRLKEHITPEGVFEMIRSDTLDDVRSALPDDIRGEVDAIVRLYVEWERELRRKVESIQVDDTTDNKATFMTVRAVFEDKTFENWYALKYVRG